MRSYLRLHCSIGHAAGQKKGSVPFIPQSFGNFFFGIVARANGFTLGQAVMGAGLYQAIAQGYQPGQAQWGNLLKSVSMGPIAGAAFMFSDKVARFEIGLGVHFGDNPGDSTEIEAGYDYYGIEYGH